GQRARVARLDLRDQHEPGGALGVRARPGVRPRAGVQAVLHRVLHDPVVGRVELDLVHAVAPPVVAVVLGWVDVGQFRVALVSGGARVAADPVQALGVRRGREDADGLAECGVQAVLVQVHAWRRLVEDLVRGGGGGGRLVWREGHAVPFSYALKYASWWLIASRVPSRPHIRAVASW